MALCRQLFGEDLFFPLVRGFPLGQVANFELEGKKKLIKSMPLDLVESDKGYTLKADIPGVEKQNVKLDVDKDVLSLSVDQSTSKEEEKEENVTKWHRSERSSTYSKRVLKMPEDADMDNIQAKYENGVLTVEVPKKEVQQKQRQVSIA